ncbi:Stf0 sulphotransferase [Ruegeria denitrificans]|uniref:Stf0 sulphotransferase n=1 Tax=Ruegeria denitrificans TaxID=1715692 RepID=A0A0P1I1B1_9RHOB|nr:Stf0 sulphotransferase [Ruegeria denitrificans]
MKAEQTGLWHQNSDGSEFERLSPPADPIYDPIAIAHRKAELESLHAAWRNWFAAQRITPYTIRYDHLARDPIGELSRVLNLIGLDPAQAAKIATPTAKLADETNRDWVRRFLTDQPTL